MKIRQLKYLLRHCQFDLFIYDVRRTNKQNIGWYFRKVDGKKTIESMLLTMKLFLDGPLKTIRFASYKVRVQGRLMLFKQVNVTPL